MNKNIIRQFSFVLALMLMISVFAGCQPASVPTEATQESTTKESVQAGEVSYLVKLIPQEKCEISDPVVSGMNQYAFDVMKNLYKDENMTISPVSLELALLMTATGAKGETREEMLKSLRMNGFTDEEIFENAKQLMWRANQNGLHAANSIFVQKDFGLDPDFREILTKTFMAGAFEEDFINQGDIATKNINRWTNENTNGKIPELLGDELTPDTRLVIVNTLYFLGKWAQPFKSEDTNDQVFHGTKGDNTVPFMNATLTIDYYEGKTFQYIALPFRGTEDESAKPLAMSFVLPKEGNTIQEAFAEVQEIGFSAIIEAGAEERVKVVIPKFEFEYGTSMVETMKNLGMKLAFDGADFSAMTTEPVDLAISDIIHKTYIKIDEEGAEAAAATGVVVGLTAVQDPGSMKIFIADRPFLFSIYDTDDSVILFSGVTANI
jgi:serpin B